MLRLLEFALFLMPFVAYGVWLWSGRRFTRELWWGTMGSMFVLLMAAAWLELSQAVPPGLEYVPAHVENGRLVPGHSVRRTAP